MSSTRTTKVCPTIETTARASSHGHFSFQSTQKPAPWTPVSTWQVDGLGRRVRSTGYKVLLLDEPSLGLAPKVVKEVFEKIKEINEKRKTAIVVVEHNIKSILEIVSRAYVLDKGRVVVSDTPHNLLSSDVLEKVFLGSYKA